MLLNYQLNFYHYLDYHWHIYSDFYICFGVHAYLFLSCFLILSFGAKSSCNTFRSHIHVA